MRIGDFGLAVNEGGAEPTDAYLSIESSMDESDLTSGASSPCLHSQRHCSRKTCAAGVGTSLYIAPEMMSRGRQERSVKYSNKIDSEPISLPALSTEQ